MKQALLADVWGDTVNLRDLGIGMVIGMVISISCYLAASMLIKVQNPDLPDNLLSAYSLLFGIGGCVLSAVISARLFKPKRVLNEEEFSENDRDSVIKELKIDIEREKEELKYLDPKVEQEMKDLKLYDLFAGTDTAEPKIGKKAGDI
ncbi:hypothetical protein [Megasphaera sueciensis]|jgi:hypothetical protein|uniref:hypothetical protein n=1 Tax=Megasphaera sueciensis TaxID=349094 RepID=UPI003D062AEB|nr:hypothetical protein [Megasphaera sp.]